MARRNGKDRGLFERPMGSGIWWIHYHDANGRKHREKGGNKTEARALYMRRKTEIRAGMWTAPGDRGMPQSAAGGGATAGASTTLGDFALAWLKERAPHLTPAVREDYERLLRFHVFDLPLARRRLAEIHDGDISRLIHDLSAKTTRGHKPLSPRRINMVVARLRTIFATARRRKLVTDDPMQYVANLREPKSEVDPFDLGEALRIIDAARGWERSFLSLLLFTGLRPNEALALAWDAIDFEHGLILVRRTVHRRYGFGLPKTRGSERGVEMSATVRAALTEQRARSQLRGDLVFPSESGTAIDLANFRRRNWPCILRAAKVRPRVIYQCRHTFARLALEQGDTPQHIAAMLGHSTLEMLFRIYGRWMGRPESSALAKLDAAIGAWRGVRFGVRSEYKSDGLGRTPTK